MVGRNSKYLAPCTCVAKSRVKLVPSFAYKGFFHYISYVGMAFSQPYEKHLFQKTILKRFHCPIVSTIVRDKMCETTKYMLMDALARIVM